jgi:hypothetical protein
LPQHLRAHIDEMLTEHHPPLWKTIEQTLLTGGGCSVTVRYPLMLEEPQRSQIFKAIEEAGLDPKGFDLADDGAEVRIKHTLSAWCFTLCRDKTWRYVGTFFVGDGPERPFDRSWRTVIPLMSLWLAEVKGRYLPANTGHASDRGQAPPSANLTGLMRGAVGRPPH